MACMLCRNLFPVIDLRHPPHSSAAEARILVTVPPTINCSLNKTTLAPQAGVQLR